MDENKVFLLNRGEMEGRWDPEMAIYRKEILQFAFESKPLKSFLKKPPQYGANEAGVERVSGDETRYIRITDIDENGQLRDDLGVTAGTIEPRYLLKNSDLLIARSGNTVGKSYLHRQGQVSYPCIFAGYMIRFEIDEQEINPEYVFAYTQLKPYADWTKAVQRTAGQPNINAEEYKSLLIPVPPRPIQDQIVALMKAAYAAKSDRDRAAAALLSSTDDYLLSTLGIELPPPGKGDLQERVFFRQMSEVTGGRMDPEYFHPERTMAIQAVMGGKYPAQRLYHISDNKRIITTENLHQLPYIGLENVESGSGTLVKSDEKSDFGTALYFEEGWVLYAKLRPYLNKVWYSTFRGYCSTEFVVLNSQVVDNQFLAAFLQSKVIVQQTRHMMSGNTLPRLQPEDIDRLMIPVPPRDVQDEIIRVTDQKRQQALSLQSEGRQLLAEARRQVEQIILGH